MQLWRYGQAIERLGERYRLEGSLGSGGMADVCLAWDEQLQAQVAIKVIKAEELEQRTLNRFLKEAAQVAKWRHPHILRFYGEVHLELLDPARGSVVPYIVMEYAQGGDLQHRLHKGQAYPLADTLMLFSQLCSAVAYAHAHGLIHRDLKPQNILFRRLPDGSEQALLSDFGLAVEVSATHHSFARGGTLPYMAPEQLRGQPQPASDIFSLGVILYQLCTGLMPFQRSLQDLHNPRAMSRSPIAPSLLNHALPPALDAVTLRALAEEPAQRYADADEFWLALQTVAASPSYRTSRRSATGPVSIPPSAPPGPSRPSNPGIFAPPSSAGPSRPSSPGILMPPPSSAGPTGSLPAPVSLTTADLDISTRVKVPRVASNTGPVSSVKSARFPSLRDTNTGVKIPRLSNTGPVSSVRSARMSSNPRMGPHTSVGMRAQRGNATIARRGARGSARKAYFLVAALLLLVFILSAVAATQFTFLYNAFASLAPDPTITITPASQTLRQNYTLMLTHNPTAPDQLASHTLNATASNSQTIPTTGMSQVPGTQAKGQLTFYNSAFVAQSVSAGTVVVGTDGVQVITDALAQIPAADSNTGNISSIAISAHAVNIGAKGNIAALDINQICCVSSKSIFVKNLAAFAGGQDAHNYHFPTQDDIDQVANSMQVSLEQKARQQLQSQLAPAEQLASSITCALQTTPDHPAGPQGLDVPRVTVAVADVCQAEAYSGSQLQQQISAQFQQQAIHQFGAGYQRVGDIQIRSTIQPARSAGVLPALSVVASALWKYAFGATQVHQMLLSIVSKNRAQASVLLKRVHGVAGVNIQGGGDPLPAQIEHIHLIIGNG